MNSENQTNNESYEFISETIKKRPVNKRRVVLKTLFTIFLGVVFGAVACFTYVLLLPTVEKYFSVPELNQVRLTLNGEEQQTEQENPSEDMAAQTETAATDTDSSVTAKEAEASVEQQTSVSAPEETSAKVSELTAGKEEKEPELSKQEGSVDSSDHEKKTAAENEAALNKAIEAENRIAEKEVALKEEKDDSQSLVSVSGELTEAGAEISDKQFEINDYTLLYQKLGDVAGEVSRSLVTVTGVSSDNDWFSSKYEKGNQTTGLILADNGKELLILARTSVVKDADEIQVTFCDGERLMASLKKSDSNTGLSVVAVELEEIGEATSQEYRMGELGNSKARDTKGKPVIAVGDPLGVSDSIAIGQITSNSIIVDKTDSNVSILTTDIYGSTNGSGVLCDFDGKILGIICHDGSTADTKNLIRAYSITDIRATIEKILNGQDIAYLGIQGTDVTDDISDLYDIPKGAYVKQVVPDSPAMKAGIQNGDVIVKLGTNEITSFSDYKDAMLKSQPKDATTVTIKRLGREEYVDISYEVVLGKL